MQQEDPAWGDWCVSRSEFNLCVNASSLVTGVVLEKIESHDDFSQQTMPNISTRLSNILTGKARVHTKAASEILACEG